MITRAVSGRRGDEASIGKCGVRITSVPSTLVRLGDGQCVAIATERWVLEPWEGDPDPPELKLIWARKPKFVVNGHRSCAELAILADLQTEGWDGVWVSAFGNMIRDDWFPTQGVRTLAEPRAPRSAVDIFGRLRAANHGKLDGFFDVFAWRGGRVRFVEAKVGRDPFRDTQARFVQTALSLGHSLEEFTIVRIDVARPPSRI